MILSAVQGPTTNNGKFIERNAGSLRMFGVAPHGSQVPKH